MNISKGEAYLSINELGFIKEYSFDEQVTEDETAYFTMFKEHERFDPSCKILNTSLPVKHLVGGSDWLSYSKNIEGPSKQFQALHRLELVDHGFDWNIKIEGEYPENHRFGITLPVGCNSSFFGIDKEIETPLAVYLSEIFYNQTLLNFPLISAISQNKTVVFTSSQVSIQFFIYEEKKVDWLRITSITNHTNELTVAIRFFDKDQELDLRKIYLQKYTDIGTQQRMYRHQQNLELQESMPQLVIEEFERIKKPIDVTCWMDLIRTVRHPGIFWVTDYIQPRQILLEMNDVIRDSEIYLYGDRQSMTLKDGYSADISQEVAFHTIRAQLRSEEGEISLSVDMFRKLYEKWYPKISVIRQSNLIVHWFRVSLCCKMFEEACECISRHEELIYTQDEKDRTELGLTDNQSIMNLAIWYFMKYSKELVLFIAKKNNLNPKNIWNHKKTSLIDLLDTDNSWIVSFCSRSFYEHARIVYQDLPPWNRR